MENAAAGAHPLYIAGKDGAFVPKAVAVGGGAVEHVGDGFDTAMRMIREAAQGTFERIVEGEVVEEQEGIELVADARGYGAKQTHACAFDGGPWFDNLGDCA